MNIKTKHKILLILTGAVLTMALGAYNNFPFFYPDTNSYLYTSQYLTVPNDRPIFYGLFLRMTHMRENLYMSMFLQSLLLAYMLYLPFRIYKRNNYYGIHYLLTMVVLVLCTGYSFYACYLMPDMFGMTLFISSWLLLHERLGLRDTVTCLIVLIGSLLVHNAHLYIYLALAGFTGLRYIVGKSTAQRVPLKRWLAINAVTLILVTGLLSSFQSRPSSHLFFTSRLNETGILSDFLHRKCETGNYIFCAYRDSLIGDFLWNSNSPRNKIDENAAQTIPEYWRMLWDMLKDVPTLKKIAIMSGYSMAQQFFSFEIEPQNKYNTELMSQIFAVHQFDASISFQNRPGRLDFELLNNRQWLLTIFGFGILAVVLIFGRLLPPVIRQNFAFLLFFLGINAMVFGTFSTVLTRYQGRIVPMLPYMISLMLPYLIPFFKRIVTELSQPLQA